MVDEMGRVRPLLAGTVRWDAHGAAIDLGSDEVRVDGDPTALTGLLGGCDGRHAVDELAPGFGSPTRLLLKALLDQGALVDAEHAWRILHRQSSSGSALGRGASAAELADLREQTFDVPCVGEAVALEPQAGALTEIVSARQSWLPTDPRRQTSFAELSSILELSYGLRVTPEGRTGPVASAGAMHPLVLHVLLRGPLEPAHAGLWWYDPLNARLTLLRSIADVELESLLLDEPSTQELIACNGPVVFVSADLRRPSRKYGARAYRYALMEAGGVMQSALLGAAELGVPARPIGGVDDRAAHAALALPDTAVVLLALLLGG